ncbi:MAG: acetamidase/formamidase family protein [Anaerolineales bacterium]|nr:acetamidase/formamidase family protein [Anaerolineales bacterium]
MTVHTFRPTHYWNTLGPHAPVLEIGDGDTVITTTVDAAGRDHTGERVTPGGNPQTGPFYVAGAEPGDMLALHLNRLTPNRERGWSLSGLAPNVVEPGTPLPKPGSHFTDWRMDLEAGVARLWEPQGTLAGLALPLAPMLGCFGVAPWGKQAISTGTSAEHGGNMDYRGFVAGTTVYFPVFEPGALVFVGDGHAVQGDGEILGTGIEISFDVEFTVRVLKGRRSGWPRGENEREIFAVGNARPLDQALQHATTEMLSWLQADYGLSDADAGLLLGHAVRYEIGNVFDPAYTVICKVDKQTLAQLAGQAA